MTVWIDEDRVEPFKEVVASFTEETGIPVEVEGQPSEELRKGFLGAQATGRAPDVLVGAHDWLGELMADGAVLPVKLPDPAALAPAALQAVMYDGAVYGTPLSTENIAVVRNDALTELAPATFDEMVAEGEKLVARGQADRPFLVQQGEGGDPYHLYPIQTSFVAPVFATDATGSYTADLAMGGDAGRAAADYLADLGRRGVLDPAVDADVARDTFLAGRAPYILTGPWNVTAFLEAGLDITVLPVPPAGTEPAQPFVGVQVAFIARSTPDEVSATALLDHLVEHETQLALYEATGRAPATKSAIEAISDDPVMQGFAEAGAEGAPMPAIPQMSVVWAFWGGTQIGIVGDPDGDVHGKWDAMVSGIEGAILDS